jgi:hypothetical protein
LKRYFGIEGFPLHFWMIIKEEGMMVVGRILGDLVLRR